MEAKNPAAVPFIRLVVPAIRGNRRVRYDLNVVLTVLAGPFLQGRYGSGQGMKRSNGQ